MTKKEWFSYFLAFLAIFQITVLNIQVVNQAQEIKRLENQPKTIIYKVDNAGAEMHGRITDKEIIEGRYTVTAGAYGKFLVTKEQYENLKVGDQIPEYLKKRGS